MRLRKLQLRRLPGIERPIEVDLAEGLNIVTGPNGSGKSSLCRGMRALLWPDLEPGIGVEVEGQWSDDGTTVRSERLGRRIRWSRNGAESGPPPLPGAQVAPCYTLGAAELFAGGSLDEAIAREIRLRMAGGYDLERILEQRFPLAPRHGHAEKAALETRRKDHAAVQSDFRQLAKEEEALEGLLGRQRLAKQAHDLQQNLKDAVQMAETRRELEAARAALEGYPEGMEKIQGNELERLDELEGHRAELQRDLESCDAKVQAALRSQEERALPGGVMHETDLENADARARHLRELEGEIKARVEDKRTAQAALAHAWRDLGGSVEAEEMHLDLPSIARLDGFLARAEVLRHTRASLETAIDHLADGPDPQDIEGLRQAAGSLREWLAASDEGVWWQRKWAVAALGALGALAGALAGPMIDSSVAAFVPIGGALFFSMIPVAVHALSRKEDFFARRRFDETGHAGPEKWNRKGVEELLREIDKKLAAAEVDKKQDDRRKILKDQLKRLLQEENEHKKERQVLQETLGVDPGESALGLVDLARRMQAWRGARAVLEESEATLAGKKSDRDRVLVELNQFMSRVDYPRAADAEEAELRLESIKKRNRGLGDAFEEFEQAERDRALSEDRLRRLEERVAQVFVQAGLDAGNHEELLRRVQRLPEFKAWKQKEDALAGRLRALAVKLEDHTELQQLDVDEALRREAAAQAQAAELAGISIEVGKIQERVEQARKGRRMERALAGLEQARQALAARREEALVAAAGRFLLGKVEEEYRQECLPALLRHAMEWSAAFTGHACELKFTDGDPGEFRVVETASGREVALHELSGGTRRQILLAVRLAFAVHSEAGTQLPFLLDDALSGADPERFRAVAAALLEVVNAGRQVVYLTTSHADLALWRAICSESGMPAPKVVDLAHPRGVEAAPLPRAARQAPRRAVVPDPAGLDAAGYAQRIQAPALDAFAPVAGLHLVHLLQDDLPLLHRLLEGRVENVGQWRSVVRQGTAGRLLPAEKAARLSALCDGAEEFFRAWREGRGKSVDRGALEESGVVSEQFLDGIGTVAADIEGDATMLLRALENERHEEVRGFFGGQLEELRAFFEEEGYIDERAALDAGALGERVVEACGEHLRAGRIGARELHGMVQRLWAGAGAAAQPAAKAAPA